MAALCMDRWSTGQTAALLASYPANVRRVAASPARVHDFVLYRSRIAWKGPPSEGSRVVALPQVQGSANAAEPATSASAPEAPSDPLTQKTALQQIDFPPHVVASLQRAARYFMLATLAWPFCAGSSLTLHLPDACWTCSNHGGCYCRKHRRGWGRGPDARWENSALLCVQVYSELSVPLQTLARPVLANNASQQQQEKQKTPPSTGGTYRLTKEQLTERLQQMDDAEWHLKVRLRQLKAEEQPPTRHSVQDQAWTAWISPMNFAVALALCWASKHIYPAATSILANVAAITALSVVSLLLSKLLQHVFELRPYTKQVTGLLTWGAAYFVAATLARQTQLGHLSDVSATISTAGALLPHMYEVSAWATVALILVCVLFSRKGVF